MKTNWVVFLELEDKDTGDSLIESFLVPNQSEPARAVSVALEALKERVSKTHYIFETSRVEEHYADHCLQGSCHDPHTYKIHTEEVVEIKQFQDPEEPCCDECTESGNNFVYERTVANGDIYNCKTCGTQTIIDELE